MKKNRKKNKKVIASCWLAGIIFLLVLSSAEASRPGAIQVELVNSLASNEVFSGLLTSPRLLSPIEKKPDDAAILTFFGLDAGTYVFHLKKKQEIKWREEIVLAPGQFFHLKIKLADDGTVWQVERYDLEDIGGQTTISRAQLSRLPSADNIWSVIENQDFSATTNRIDSGGLWAERPALWSSRGGTSWTQNEIRLNGFNVTEPYFGGAPLFLPDLQTIQALSHRHGLPLSSVTTPGGRLEIETRQGEEKLGGGLSYSFIEPYLTTSNITPGLIKEGIKESHTFHHDRKLRFWLSGPIISQRRRFFMSVLSQDLGRDIANYESLNRSRLLAGSLRLDQKLPWGEIALFWTGQQLKEEESGARRNMAREATVQAEKQYQVAQLWWKSNPTSRQSWRAGFSLAWQNTSTHPTDYSGHYACRELFRPVFWEAPLQYGKEKKINLNFLLDGSLLLGSMKAPHHWLNFGAELIYRSYASEQHIPGHTHLLFLEGQPALAALFRPDPEEAEAAFDLSLNIEDNWTISRYFILHAGAKLTLTRGWSTSGAQDLGFGGYMPSASSRIEWLTLLPRLSLTLPFREGRNGYLKFYFGQTAHFLPLNYLRWGNPGAVGALIYSWSDLDKDKKLDDGELGPLLRREGPFFSRVDPNLLRPRATDYAISFVQRLGKDFFLSFTGYYRLTKNLIETQNIGLAERDYEKFFLEDSGDDRIWGTHDDLVFTIYNRLPQARGKDFFLLTNPDAANRTSRYRGADLTILRRFSTRHFFYFSFTATEAFGTTSPGNTEWENDEAVIGWLYDDPNSLINARGRLRFDRAYTARLGFNLTLPGAVEAGFILKYYDGQPFSRKIIVTGLNQGPLFIQAFPRGIARYEFNMTADFQLEKIFSLGWVQVSAFLEGYNIFNQHLATEENEWTGPSFPLRYATEIQSPRVFRLGLRLTF